MAEWKLVPVEPDDKMMLLGGFSFAGRVPNEEVFPEVRKVWERMLSAAPQAPSGQQAEAIVWALKFPGDGGRLCLSTMFDSEYEANEYASRCDSVEVVTLALAGQQSERPAPAGQAVGDEHLEGMARELMGAIATEPSGKVELWPAQYRFTLGEWFKKGYRAALASQAERPAPDTVPVPQNEDQAAMMALLGEHWLRVHAPHRLRPAPAGQAVELPENETEAMHDAVMGVLYHGGIVRTRTNELWQAYRVALIAASQAERPAGDKP